MYCLGDMVMEPTIDWEIIDEPELLGTYLVFFLIIKRQVAQLSI